MEHNEQMILRNENRQMEKYISIFEDGLWVVDGYP